MFETFKASEQNKLLIKSFHSLADHLRHVYIFARVAEDIYSMKRKTETLCYQKASIGVNFLHFLKCFLSCTLGGYEWIG